MTELSWWPKASTWRNCGLNVGYWSEDCEAFYQRRLEEIRNGTAQLLTASQWRDRLRYKASHTAEFRNMMDNMSDMLLRGDSQYWML
jgi:hypothetical protein